MEENNLKINLKDLKIKTEINCEVKHYEQYIIITTKLLLEEKVISESTDKCSIYNANIKRC